MNDAIITALATVNLTLAAAKTAEMGGKSVSTLNRLWRKHFAAVDAYRAVSR